MSTAKISVAVSKSKDISEISANRKRVGRQNLYQDRSSLSNFTRLKLDLLVRNQYRDTSLIFPLGPYMYSRPMSRALRWSYRGTSLIRESHPPRITIGP